MVKQPKKASSTRRSELPVGAVVEWYFGMSEQGTDVRTEFIAGVTTFLTMVYIVFVNPIILARREWIRARCSSQPASPP
jgi:hypothetical protein